MWKKLTSFIRNYCAEELVSPLKCTEHFDSASLYEFIQEGKGRKRPQACSLHTAEQ